jgi:ketosteroid isomerase-like protein
VRLTIRTDDGQLIFMTYSGAIAPAYAQQVDAQTEEAAEGISAKWIEAVNKGDAKTAVALLTPDGFSIDVYGESSGSTMEEKIAQKAHEMGVALTSKTDDVKSLASGQLILAIGTYSVAYANNPTTKTAEGKWMRLLVKDGPDWKIVAQDLTRQAPPAPPK